MVFAHTAMIGYREKAMYLLSQRRRERKGRIIKRYCFTKKTHVTSAFSAPLRENTMLNLQHRLVFRVYEDLQHVLDQARTTQLDQTV
jgi:tRNA 2-selenouridine synthase SelU